MLHFSGYALVVSLFALLVAATAHAERSATATATAKTVIEKGIGILKVKDLDFGTGVQGDAATTLPVASGAQFTVSGQASKNFTVAMPADNTLKMLTGGGGTADKEIAVNTFVHDAGATPTLDANGARTLKVSATRAAIRSTQVTGSYAADFTVTVAY